MSKVIEFKCPHGDHAAYFHSADNALCLVHGRLLYTDPPEGSQKKKNYRSSWLKTFDKDAKKLERLKIKIGKLIAKALK